MPSRSNSLATRQDGSDAPRTPARRVSQVQKPVTPISKPLRNPQLDYPSPLTPPRRGILDYGSSVPLHNAPATPTRVLHEGPSARTRSRISYTEHTRNTVAVTNSLPVKEELTDTFSTPPTTPLQPRSSTRLSDPAPGFIPVQSAYSRTLAPTGLPTPDPSPFTSRVAQSSLTTTDFADIINKRSTLQTSTVTSQSRISSGRPSIKLEDLEFEDVDIFSVKNEPEILSSVPKPSSVKPPRAPSQARPQTRSQTRAQDEQAKTDGADPPLFEHDGAIGIFRNGQRLRPFQASDLHRLVAREKGEEVCGTNGVNNIGYVLAYDMGLGKTVLSIALIVRNPPPEDFNGAKATLVIVPSSGVMKQWLQEVKKFAPHLTVCYYDSYKTKLLVDADIVLCTYTQVQRQHSAFAPNLKTNPQTVQMPENRWPLFKHTWYRVIAVRILAADEAHLFRNSKTVTSEGVLAIQKKHGLCLTGTPCQNSYMDYYPLIKFLGVTYEKLHDQPRFKRIICSNKNKAEIIDSAARYRLNVLEQSFFIIRKKDDDATGNGTPLVLLPPRTDHIVDVELTYWERIVYQHIRGQRVNILAKITRLRKACDHPKLVSEDTKLEDICGEVDDAEYAERCLAFSTKGGIFCDEYASSRINSMLKVLAGRKRGDKTIIFTHFTRLIPAITHALDGSGIRWNKYTGSMSQTERQEALEQIQVDKKYTVIIISIKAGGIGLNITACNSVIIMDPWWNPFFEEQAISRVHRIGQTKPVDVYHLVVTDSLEEYIMETQESKRRMIEHGESDVKFEPEAELDQKTMRSWLRETKSEQS